MLENHQIEFLGHLLRDAEKHRFTPEIVNYLQTLQTLTSNPKVMSLDVLNQLVEGDGPKEYGLSDLEFTQLYIIRDAVSRNVEYSYVEAKVIMDRYGRAAGAIWQTPDKFFRAKRFDTLAMVTDLFRDYDQAIQFVLK